MVSQIADEEMPRVHLEHCASDVRARQQLTAWCRISVLTLSRQGRHVVRRSPGSAWMACLSLFVAGQAL